MTKNFDCVDMKRTAQEDIRRELEGVSRAEEIAYWRNIEFQMTEGRGRKPAASRTKR